MGLKQRVELGQRPSRGVNSNVVETVIAETALFPERAGDLLRAARVKAGLDLTDVATKTRVPLRHLEAIEAGDYSGLPSSTYCVGFVRAYARAIDADEVALTALVRGELNMRPNEKEAFVEYEISDPKLMPGKILWLTAAVIALLVIVGFVLWRNMSIADPRDAAPVSIDASEETNTVAQAVPATAPATKPTGLVTLTATKPVWLKIYEADGKRIFEKEMALGETYTIPADAIKPQILTGRPEALRVSVGGQDVAPLGPPERTVKDLDISAQALTSRSPTVAAPSTQP